MPEAWAANGEVTGIGANGGFEVDLAWRNGKATTATIRSVGGASTEVRAGKVRKAVNLKPGGSVTLQMG